MSADAKQFQFYRFNDFDKNYQPRNVPQFISWRQECILHTSSITPKIDLAVCSKVNYDLNMRQTTLPRLWFIFISSRAPLTADKWFSHFNSQIFPILLSSSLPVPCIRQITEMGFWKLPMRYIRHFIDSTFIILISDNDKHFHLILRCPELCKQSVF